jgi:mono/diheme cytochrome c family protein
MKTPPVIIILALSFVFLAGACATARKTEPLAPPVNLSDPKVAHGQKVFFQHCHQCHPHGQGGLGPAIVNKPLPEFLMSFQVRHGLGTMPSFGADKIPPQDMEALMEYIKAVRQNPPFPGSAQPAPGR